MISAPPSPPGRKKEKTRDERRYTFPPLQRILHYCTAHYCDAGSLLRNRPLSVPSAKGRLLRNSTHCRCAMRAGRPQRQTGQSERRAVRGGDRGRASTPQGAGEGGARCEYAVGRCLGRTGRGHWGVSGRRAASLGQAERKFHCDRKGKGPARRIWRASSLGALSPTPGPRARLGNATDEKTAPTTMCIFKI